MRLRVDGDLTLKEKLLICAVSQIEQCNFEIHKETVNHGTIILTLKRKPSTKLTHFEIAAP